MMKTNYKIKITYDNYLIRSDGMCVCMCVCEDNSEPWGSYSKAFSE